MRISDRAGFDCTATGTCKCGISSPGATNRIIDGVPASTGEVPWQAGLYNDTYKDKPFCGGVLVSDWFVLTAAHCLDNQENSNNLVTRDRLET